MVGAAAEGLRLETTTSLGTAVLSGFAPGGEGEFVLGRASLEAQYVEGTLDGAAGSVASEDLVDGKALLGVRLIDWLRLKGGIHVRSYVASGGTERWVFWEARARVDVPLGGPALRGYAEGWRVLGAENQAPAPLDQAQGAEAGIRARLPGGHFWVRLGYAIDDTKFGGGTGRETVETFVLAIGAGIPASLRP